MLLQIGQSLVICHETHLGLARSANHFEDEIQLVIPLAERNALLVAVSHDVRGEGEAVPTWEQTSALLWIRTILFKSAEKLAPDDSSSPNVNFFTVVFLHEDEFGCAVEPGCHVAGHLSFHVETELSCLLENLCLLCSFQGTNINSAGL